MCHALSKLRFAAAGLAAAASSLPAVANAQPPAEIPRSAAPVPLGQVDPVYPESEMATGNRVDVIVDFKVDADGHVTLVKVQKSAGKAFDAAALTAAKQWTFAPATENGKAVPASITLPIHFDPPPTENVSVRGPLERRRVGVPDYQIPVGELRAVPRANAGDVLKLAPGFLLTNEGGSGHAEQVFLRGFDAHEGQDLEFSVDGVPLNDAGNYHGNGYADTHFILPELIQSVRVLEGPYAPQQGDFAVAGSAEYHLGLERRGLTAEYSFGSYNTQRFLLLWGPNDASTGTFGGAEYYTTDGFGTNRQAKRGTAIGQYEMPLGTKGTLRINATAYATVYNSAGVVREDDYDSGKIGFYGAEDNTLIGNTASRVHFAITYENRFQNVDVSQQLFVIDRSMRLLENWTGFLADVQLPTQSPHAQRGDQVDFHFDEVTAGARGFARWHGEAFGLRQEFEGGYFARVDQTTSTQYRDMAANGDPYLTDADLTSTLADVGVYADATLRVLPWLQFRGGVRADMFLFDVLNNCAVNAQQGVDSPSKQYLQVDQPCLSQLEHGVYREPQARSSTGDGAIMPRGTLLVGPVDHFQFSVSAGTGVRSVDPSYVAQGLLTPFVQIQSGDFGVAYDNQFGKVNLGVKTTFFYTHSDQDLLFDPSVGRSTLASGSSRTGWAGAARAVLGDWFDVAANATLVKATFDDTHLLVPYVPDLVLRGDAAVFHELPWPLDHKPVRATLGYGVSYVGRRPLPYSEFSDIIFVSDASLSLNWSIWTVRFSGQNLFDAKYKLGEYNYASDFHSQTAPTLAPQRAFTAGAPQTLMLTVAATLGGAP